MPTILLISMPFASAQFASMGLSSLKAALSSQGIACEILYLNLAFRDFTGDTSSYDQLTNHWSLGEWVFGGELFGQAWADEGPGSFAAVSSALAKRPNSRGLDEMLVTARRYRQLAGKFIDKIMSGVSWSRYQLIGFTSAYAQQVASLALAQRVKRAYPSKTIVFGGANCQSEMGTAILEHFPFVDWVISGDGEESFPRAIQEWFSGNSLKGITGVTFREHDNIVFQETAQVLDLEALPPPDFADYFQAIKSLAPDLAGRVPLSLEFSRGCWWAAKSQCIFCGIHSQMHTYRHKSAGRALREITELTWRHNTSDIWVVDTNLAPAHFQNLMPKLAAKSSKLSSFFVETKADITKRNLELLKSAGTNDFQPGIESLDTEILQYMRKGTSKLLNIRVLKWARSCGLRPLWNFLHSFPGENPAAYARMSVLIPYLVHLQPPSNVGAVALQRFSPMYDYPQMCKITNVRASSVYQSIYPFDRRVLDQLAYTFDYDTESTQAQEYLAPVLQQIARWQQLWDQKEPPMLAHQRTASGSGLVFDTRPISRQKCVQLEAYLYLALLSCESECRLPEILASVKEALGDQNYPGDEVVTSGVGMLKTQGFIVEEDGLCLSLVHELETISGNEDSVLAYLLEGDEKNAVLDM